MNTYQPSDEQMEGLAAVVLDPDTPERLDDRPQDRDFWIEEARKTAASPAFQAIIRAAQIQALNDAAEFWAADPDHHVFETDRDIRNWLREGAPTDEENA